MSCSPPIPFSNGLARIVAPSELMRSRGWNRAFQDKCKDHRFYEILQQTLVGEFDHYYAVISDRSGKLRAIQPMFFVQQNIAEGVHGRLRRTIEAIRRRFPRFLTMRVLMVGCAAGEGHLGSFESGDEAWVAEALHETLGRYARRNKASLVVLKDFPASYREALRSFSSDGYTRVASMPSTSLPLPFADFDHYLGSLGRATRKKLRRKFRKTEQLGAIVMEVRTDVTECVDEIYPLYLQVHERSRLKFERLTRDYFMEIGRRMGERARFFIWRRDGRAVAFSHCMVHGGTIHDECLGMDYEVAYELNLYFYTLRDILRWALANGFHTYCSTPLNYEPKLHLGCSLVPLDLYVMHTASLLNPLFRRILRFIQPTRHDPVLRRFPNAHQL